MDVTPSVDAGLDWFDVQQQRFLDQHHLPAEYARDIESCFLPLAEHIRQRTHASGPLLVGINGAQGSGKSALAQFLLQILTNNGLRTASLSLDDFYLPRTDRETLARTVHPLLAVRGVPGTHDVALLACCLKTLRALPAGKNAQWPCFDKASDDRAGDVHSVDGPLAVILLEGWCVGTPPEPAAALTTSCNDLERYDDANGRWRRYVNERLGTDYQSLFRELDLLCFLQAPSLQAVRRWRIEQETKLRAANVGSALMSDADVLQFIQHFERLTRAALRILPGSADIVLKLDEWHRCTSCNFLEESVEA